MATAVHAERASESWGWPRFDSLQEHLCEARRAATTVRQTAEGAAADAAAEVQRYPLRAVGTALIAGAVVGSLVGFGAAWFACTPRRRW